MKNTATVLPALIRHPGDVTFGYSIAPPLSLDLTHWDKQGLIPRRRTERKAWIYAATLNDDFFAAMAIVDAGYVGTAFAYLYDRKTGFFLEEKITKPFAFADDFAPSLQTRWLIADDHRRWEISPDSHNLVCRFTSDTWHLTLDLTSGQPGLNALCPSSGRPFNYTFKNTCMPVQASVRANQQQWEHSGASGCIDFSAGYPPRKTIWNWASFIGQTSAGQPFGLNLVAHHNDGLENALWLDGKIIPAGQAFFDYEKPMEKNHTRLTVPDLNLELLFTPEGCRRENLNAIVIVSDFVQPFGSFTGSFEYAGQKINAGGVGVVEDHRAVW